MTTKEKGPLWLALLLGGMLLAGGAVVTFLIGQPILDNAKASTTWPQAPGTVVASNVAQRTEKGKTKYWVDVRYTFEIDGTEKEGDTVWFGEYQSSNRIEMDTIVKKYPVGKDVLVYYNPADTAVCVLEPGTTWSSYFLYGLGWCLMIAGGLVAGGSLISRLM